MNPDQYFKMFFAETDKITDFCFVKESEINGTLHIFEYNLTKEDILKEILKMPIAIKEQIRDKFIQIDFKNGDINHFVNYILEGHYNLLVEQYKNSEAV